MSDFTNASQAANKRMIEIIEERKQNSSSYPLIREDGKLYWHAQSGQEFEITDAAMQRKDMI